MKRIALILAKLFAVCAALGLILNLMMPRLDWINEAQAVKRSGSAVLAVFVDWGIVLLAGLLFFLTRKFLSVGFYLLLLTVVFAAVTWIMRCWLRRRGAAIFAHL